MDDLDGIIIFGIILTTIVLVFVGFKAIVKKSLSSPPKPDKMMISTTQMEQKRKMDDIRRRQKDYMRHQKQRIKDLQRL